MIPRSWLFVPGDAPTKIGKAAGTGADALILDLEDSVAISRKPEARVVTSAGLKQRTPNLQYWVRVNPLDSGMTLADLTAVMPAGPDGIVLPKAESGADITLSRIISTHSRSSRASRQARPKSCRSPAKPQPPSSISAPTTSPTSASSA